MRITDLFLALPGPLLAIAVVAALGPSYATPSSAVAIVWWPFYARIMRGEVRALAARPHLEAATLAGAGPVRRGLRHLLPGAVPAIVVTASLDVGNLVVTLAALSFLGLGAPAPAPELGRHGGPGPAVPAPGVVGPGHAGAGRLPAGLWARTCSGDAVADADRGWRA